jgi:hypothetical protein
VTGGAAPERALRLSCSSSKGPRIALPFDVADLRPAVPEAPHVTLSNGLVRATVWLPNADHGFYRASRFDWSGIIRSLTFREHEFYGPWYDKTDDLVPDFVQRNGQVIASSVSAATGPAEEFRQPLGYDGTAPGGTFVKIGVGVLRRVDDEGYSRFARYPLVSAGEWRTTTTDETATFRHRVGDDDSGYAYEYIKSLRLVAGEPKLVISHRLENSGQHPIETAVSDHHFLTLDDSTPAQGMTLTLPFDVRTSQVPSPSLLTITGKTVTFMRRFTGDDRVSLALEGFGAAASDFDLQINHPGVSAGVRVQGDRPLSALWLWSIRTNVSVEPFVAIDVAPGAAFDWTTTYTYSALESLGGAA